MVFFNPAFNRQVDKHIVLICGFSVFLLYQLGSDVNACFDVGFGIGAIEK
jgi:hypothetical protein